MQNQLRAPIPSSKALNPANSVPRSKVKLWRATDGKGEKAAMILSMIGRECRLWFFSNTVFLGDVVGNGAVIGMRNSSVIFCNPLVSRGSLLSA